jgi:hypothetical protein
MRVRVVQVSNNCNPMNSFQHDGVWWDLRDPRKRRVGTLRFHPVKGARLRLIVPTEKPDLLPAMESYDLIHGRTTDGTAVTLFRCFDISTKGTWSTAPRPIEVFANAVIVGLHCEQPDPLLHSASVSFRHLDEWWGADGVQADPSAKHPDFAARYTSEPPIDVHDDGRFRVSVRSFCVYSVSGREASMREEARVEVTAAAPAPLSEFQKVIQACGDFLSIACLDVCDTRELSVVAPASDPHRPQTGQFYAVPIYKDLERRSVRGPHMLFRYRDVQARLPALMGAWLSQSDALHAARVLYLSGAYGGGYVESRLLDLTQAAEAFHRRFHPPGTFMDPAEFEATVLPSLQAALPESLDPSFRNSLMRRLEFANEHSLRHRLKELFVEHSDALTALVRKPKQFYSPIADHRNEFTHFPVERLSTRRRPLFDSERVLLFNFILRLLLEACFLRSMGFSTQEVAALTHACERYRQLSLRFDRAVREPKGKESV